MCIYVCHGYYKVHMQTILCLLLSSDVFVKRITTDNENESTKTLLLLLLIHKLKLSNGSLLSVILHVLKKNNNNLASSSGPLLLNFIPKKKSFFFILSFCQFRNLQIMSNEALWKTSDAMLDSLSLQLREAESRRAEAERAHQVSCSTTLSHSFLYVNEYRLYSRRKLKQKMCKKSEFF